MKKLKSDIVEFVWTGKSVSKFEKWLYEQDSAKFEQLIGTENYFEMVSFDYQKTNVKTLKGFIKANLPIDLILEFESLFSERRSIPIKGVCVKSECLDYSEPNIRDWEVEVGKEYEFLIVDFDIIQGNHSKFVNYFDRLNDYKPSGFVPMELFDIDLTNISEYYDQKITSKDILTIEPHSFTKSKYSPIEFSFWEDYYEDVERALKAYQITLKELGIVDVW